MLRRESENALQRICSNVGEMSSDVVHSSVHVQTFVKESASLDLTWRKKQQNDVG